MSSLETTELKLKTTPTAGISAEHSPYYRRLLSAGYKGFLQGTIGGASLYGSFGAVIGGLLAVPLLFTPVGWAGLALIPAAAGVGMLKGASTFGQIGSTAAINAESADLSEQRRYLLDRYYDLPEGPAGDKEAEAIKQELLRRQIDSGKPDHFFHWKTVAIGAAIGAAIALAAFSPLGMAVLAESSVAHGVAALASHIGLTQLVGAAGASGAVSMALGSAAGALAGASIGVDRYYIRKWFDHTEGVVHSSSHSETALIERSEQIERLKKAALEDEQTKRNLGIINPRPVEITPPGGPQLQWSPKEAPARFDAAKMQSDGRLAEIQRAMDIPAV